MSTEHELSPQYLYAIGGSVNFLRTLRTEPGYYMPLRIRMDRLICYTSELAAIDLDSIESEYIKSVVVLLLVTFRHLLSRTVQEARIFLDDTHDGITKV